MPIKWSPSKIEAALVKVEEQLKLAREPLNKAMLTVKEAQKIPDLPRYVTQHLFGLQNSIEAVTGTERMSYITKEIEYQPGNIQRYIDSVRNSLPKNASVKGRRTGLGEMQSLIG